MTYSESLKTLNHSGELSDHELVDLARKGDTKAFAQLVNRYEGTVAATVIGMLGDVADTEDVGQETFIRFWEGIHKFRGNASLKTYLTRIAINLSLNAIKRRRRHQDRYKNREDPANQETEGVNPSTITTGQNDQQAIVQWAIRQLEPEHRAVIVLRMIEGYSTSETAKILNKPQGTVLSRLSRAKEKLKIILKPYISKYNE